MGRCKAGSGWMVNASESGQNREDRRVHRLASRVAERSGWAKDNPAAAIAFFGAVVFSLVRTLDDLFYNVAAGIAPEEVGRDYITSLAAVVTYGSAFALVVWLPMSYVRAGNRWAGLATAVGIVVMAAFAAWEVQVAFEGPCGPNDGLLRSSTNVQDIIELAESKPLLGPDEELVSGKLLGTGHSHAVVIDCGAQPNTVYRLPRSEYLITTYEE